MDQNSGQIILLNGASSSGKSSIAHEIQARIPQPFWHISIDHLRTSGVLPLDRIRRGEFEWPRLREAFFVGFERSLRAYAGAGNNLIVEYIIETEEWMVRLDDVLRGLDVFLVGLHCSLDELEKREKLRGDRPLGDARRDHFTVHKHCRYDFEVETSQSPALSAAGIISAWSTRQKSGALTSGGFRGT